MTGIMRKAADNGDQLALNRISVQQVGSKAQIITQNYLKPQLEIKRQSRRQEHKDLRKKSRILEEFDPERLGVGVLGFYGSKCCSLQYQLNKACQQVMSEQNISKSENFFLEAESSEGVLPAQQINEENMLDVSNEGKIKRGVQNRRRKRFNKSLWTLQENLKYVRFLQENRELFCSTKENRRLLKINKMISLCIGTRSPDQCRSHHQKMVKYHDSIEGIINHVYLLHNLYVEDPLRRHEKEGKVPMRIRKRVVKGQNEPVTPQEEGEKSLWDVLCIDDENMESLQQNILYQ